MHSMLRITQLGSARCLESVEMVRRHERVPFSVHDMKDNSRAKQAAVCSQPGPCANEARTAAIGWCEHARIDGLLPCSRYSLQQNGDGYQGMVSVVGLKS